MDHLLTQLQKWFSSDHQHIALGLSLVSSAMKWSQYIRELAELYQNDLPSPQNLNMELLRVVYAHVNFRPGLH